MTILPLAVFGMMSSSYTTTPMARRFRSASAAFLFACPAAIRLSSGDNHDVGNENSTESTSVAANGHGLGNGWRSVRTESLEISHQRKSQMPKENSTDRKSTRLNSSHRCISYAVFC